MQPIILLVFGGIPIKIDDDVVETFPVSPVVLFFVPVKKKKSFNSLESVVLLDLDSSLKGVSPFKIND